MSENLSLLTTDTELYFRHTDIIAVARVLYTCSLREDCGGRGLDGAHNGSRSGVQTTKITYSVLEWTEEGRKPEEEKNVEECLIKRIIGP